MSYPEYDKKKNPPIPITFDAHIFSHPFEKPISFHNNHFEAHTHFSFEKLTYSHALTHFFFVRKILHIHNPSSRWGEHMYTSIRKHG